MNGNSGRFDGWARPDLPPVNVPTAIWIASGDCVDLKRRWHCVTFVLVLSETTGFHGSHPEE
jgi:hypothetical protein